MRATTPKLVGIVLLVLTTMLMTIAIRAIRLIETSKSVHAETLMSIATAMSTSTSIGIEIETQTSTSMSMSTPTSTSASMSTSMSTTMPT